MMRTTDRLMALRPSPVLFCLLTLLAVLWLAGGASRADVLGQALVRGTAGALLAAAAIFAGRPRIGRAWPALAILISTIVLVIAQLIPLPPALWQSLPGHGALVGATTPIALDEWRPLSLSPSGTINAASALVVPLAAMTLLLGIGEYEYRRVLAALLVLTALSALVALLQVSGGRLGNPFINASHEPGGMFANRNHLALFLAIGCLAAPVWACLGGRRPGWRAPAAGGGMLMFVLVILATGSRAGLVLAALALAISGLLTRRELARATWRAPRWMLPALVVAVAATMALFVVVMIAAGRAESIDRLVALDAAQDMRRRGLPVVIEMVAFYFPTGSGAGTFDAAFRIAEPFRLLKPTYFNHAHNDFVEVVLDTGLPGALLLVAAVAWWGWASVRAWREGSAFARLGSAMLLLVMVASLFDYPARTPTIMAVVAIAAIWLAQRERASA